MAVFSLIGSIVSSVASGIGSAASAVGSALGGGAGAATGAAGGFAQAASAVAGLGGTVMSAIGQQRAHQGAKRAEALRLRQMNLEAARARRGTVREAIVARAQALSNAEASGAMGGSGILGGQSQIAAQAGSNVQGINQGQQIGAQMFQANQQISSGQTLASMGGAFQNIGSWFAQNWEQNRRVFGTA